MELKELMNNQGEVKVRVREEERGKEVATAHHKEVNLVIGHPETERDLQAAVVEAITAIKGRRIMSNSIIII